MIEWGVEGGGGLKKYGISLKEEGKGREGEDCIPTTIKLIVYGDYSPQVTEKYDIPRS